MPGLHWIQELGPSRPGIVRTASSRQAAWVTPEREVFVPQNAFLLAGERTLLFDTLSPAAAEHVIAELERVLEGRTLDYLVVSHPDVPHAANTFAILRRYPDARLVAPRYGEGHALYHLDHAWQVGEGDAIDLGGFVVRFHEASFLDAAISLWMSEDVTGTLFTVDWMGLPLLDGEGLSFMDELDVVDEDRFYEFHARVLFWLQYVDAERVEAEMRHIRDHYRPRMIAPAHGPVMRTDVDRYLDLMQGVPRHILATGRVGVL